jgi:drug/metabolite transporter (DMT)-like permease
VTVLSVGLRQPVTAAPSKRRWSAGAKTLGVLAVVGLVVAFSLSSTLVKRADSPGVLVAFWRMVTVSVIWNALLWSTGRHVTAANVRQAFVPGIFFGLNLAVFFAGATHNSVANAALIGSLAPFLIVPAGAYFFKEYIHPRALVFAGLAFGGAALVLLSAPPNGDASLEGNLFGFVAMLLLVSYVVSIKHFRQEMDVTTFMATICPIAAVAVLPIAVAHGDVFGMSDTGWTYMLILSLTSGVMAQGLRVYAQKTIQIGTIAIAEVAQPALAVVWSFLLLGEIVNVRQATGIAIVMGGLLAFVVLHHRGDPARSRDRLDHAGVSPIELGDEVQGAFHAPVGGRAQRRGSGGVAPRRGDPRERVEGEDLDGGVVVEPGLVEDGGEPLLRTGDSNLGVERRE